METKQKLTIRHIMVVIGAIMFYAPMGSIIYNLVPVLFEGIVEQEGYPLSDLTLFFTVAYFSSAIFITPLMRLKLKSNFYFFAIAIILIEYFSVFIMRFYHNPKMWILSGVIYGATSCMAVMHITMVIEAWFNVHTATIISLVVSCLGVISAVFSPVLSGWILKYGWRDASTFFCITFCLVAILSIAVFQRRCPEDLGLKPYGVRNDKDKSVTIDTETPEVYEARKHNPLSYAVAIALTLTGYLTISCASIVPNYTASIGYPLSTAALFTSAVMMGNCILKIVNGLIFDRFGVIKGVFACTLTVGLAYVGMVTFRQFLPGLLISSFLVGGVYSMTSVALPLASRKVFGPHYAVSFSKVGTVNNLIAGSMFLVSNTLMATSDDLSVIYIAGIGICAVLLVVTIIINKKYFRSKTLI